MPIQAKDNSSILVVDDLDEDLERLQDLILSHDSDRHVKLVSSGSEAIRHVSAHSDCCVLLDYRLDGEDGIDVMRQLKTIDPLLPVIMLTGQGSEDIAALAIKEGASDYIVKMTETSTSLGTAIDNAIKRSMLQKEIAFQDFQRREFLNILIHDIRAPLRNIAVLGEFAIGDLESGDMAELKATIRSQSKLAQRACDLINSMEAFAISSNPVSLQPVSMTDAVTGAIDNLDLMITERNACIEVDELPMVMGFLPQLTQLIQNLIQNGLKYNRCEKPRINILSLDEEPGWVNIIVEDNGIGIPESELTAIFAPMKRLVSYSEYEGSGLGLAICQKIVERQHGTIHCTSEQDKGSPFHVRLRAIPCAGAQPVRAVGGA